MDPVRNQLLDINKERPMWAAPCRKGTRLGGDSCAPTLCVMEPRLIADPAKLLGYWMEWERGDTPPGRVMSNLKIAGIRELLEGLCKEVQASTEQP